jgi:hypothetical protein
MAAMRGSPLVSSDTAMREWNSESLTADTRARSEATSASRRS